MVNPLRSYHLPSMNSFPKVKINDFHMQNYPASIYSEIETFCNFLSECARQEDQLQRPFTAYRGRSALNDC